MKNARFLPFGNTGNFDGEGESLVGSALWLVGIDGFSQGSFPFFFFFFVVGLELISSVLGDDLKLQLAGLVVFHRALIQNHHSLRFNLLQV